jgi:hypothetical protein
MRQQEAHDLDLAIAEDARALVPTECEQRQSRRCSHEVDLGDVDIALWAAPLLKIGRGRKLRRRAHACHHKWFVQGEAVVELSLNELIDLWEVFVLTLDPEGFETQDLVEEELVLVQIYKGQMGVRTPKQRPGLVERLIPARWIERAVVDAADEVGQVLV